MKPVVKKEIQSEISLFEILKIHGKDLKKLEFKQYKTSVEKTQLIEKFLYYYNYNDEFRKHVKSNSKLQEYFFKGHSGMGASFSNKVPITIQKF